MKRSAAAMIASDAGEDLGYRATRAQFDAYCKYSAPGILPCSDEELDEAWEIFVSLSGRRIAS